PKGYSIRALASGAFGAGSPCMHDILRLATFPGSFSRFWRAVVFHASLMMGNDLDRNCPELASPASSWRNSITNNGFAVFLPIELMLSKGGSNLLRFATCRLRILLRIGYVSCYVSATFPATYQLRVGYKAAGPAPFWHQRMRLAHVRSLDEGPARSVSCQINPGCTWPRCGPSSFCQPFLPDYSTSLAQSACRAARFPHVNEHTPAHRRSAWATRGLASHSELPKMVATISTYIVYDNVTQCFGHELLSGAMRSSQKPNNRLHSLHYRDEIRRDGELDAWPMRIRPLQTVTFECFSMPARWLASAMGNCSTCSRPVVMRQPSRR